MSPKSPAVLVLADGSVFRGISVGADGVTSGEVVFNTAMTGYQEILTDPSYAGQVVTLTYPHIGNVGANPEDFESRGVYAAGLIIRDLPREASSWRKQEDLPEYLKRHKVVAIAGIDTRRLTRILREKGAQNGCIMGGQVDEAKALALAKAAPNMAGQDLAKVVSCEKGYDWNGSLWALGTGYKADGSTRFHVVAFDYGVKHNILRNLAERGCKVTVLPAQATAKEALALKPDGVFLSNGPGDPEPCDYAITAIREIVESGTPTFGICLGHQLLGLASGAKTIKMKFGHHGANHPVQDLDTKRVFITSQNHGFAVDEKTLPANVRTTHKSLFDGSLQGIERTDKPAFSFQGHPEASPGPREMSYLFDKFVTMMEKNQ
ncbi:Carbamoyl-phosphate synthase small chain [Usitatibacter rugosus]|uniref:Carbamoyl phosphate synthase small chain n=1 Tax=Usitatibacter rugosus TaxID=2732067 RepID=A0A6M4H118_9PROT|nr:glutamine-hydrolyzing carbamoyl-phosphate synthase small subunit [Usitatibacter rugosus]QJR12333.1 Carbamoyl-phosphate synthase small chain [Usitatibacter rugosus]